MAVAENANNMNSNRLRVAHVVFDKYRSEYEAIFGVMEPALGRTRFASRPPASPRRRRRRTGLGDDGARRPPDRQHIFVNYGKALAAYARK